MRLCTHELVAGVLPADPEHLGRGLLQGALEHRVVDVTKCNLNRYPGAELLLIEVRLERLEVAIAFRQALLRPVDRLLSNDSFAAFRVEHRGAEDSVVWG